MEKFSGFCQRKSLCVKFKLNLINGFLRKRFTNFYKNLLFLGAMSSQLSRLRMMGSALGDEIQDQNGLLDRIQQKTDRNDSVVRHQDNQMKSLLGYKN